MIPTKLSAVDFKAPEGVEYWPRGEAKYFEESFNNLIMTGMRGFDILSVNLIAFRYHSLTTDEETKIERGRTGMIRHWTEQMYVRWCEPHLYDRDIAQFAGKLTINEVECYIYPVGRVKRYEGYDEVTFNVRPVNPVVSEH